MLVTAENIHELTDAAISIGAAHGDPMFIAEDLRRHPDINKFDESEARDDHGRWTAEGGGVESVGVPSRAGALYPAEAVREERRRADDWSGVKDLPESDPRYQEQSRLYSEVFRADLGRGGIEGHFLRDTFQTVDKDGNPTDPASQQLGADDKLWSIRDLYVVPDDKTLAYNSALRDGEKLPWASRVDKWVNSSTLKQDLVTWRGAAMPQEIADQLKPGVTYVDKGFQSTALEEIGAQSYLDVRMASGLGTVPVMLEVTTSAGSRAANAGYGEVVLARNTTMQVVESWSRPDGSLYVKVNANN